MSIGSIRRLRWLASLGVAFGCSAEVVENPWDADALDDGGGADEVDGGCTTVPEECNDRDDDCDGLTDEGFDVQTDPMNCGRCSNRCRFLNADPLCIEGTCRLGACREDYYDLNGEEGDGCEYRCIRTRTAEDDWVVCNDSIDNDCDGSIDFLDPDCSCVPEVCNHLDDDCDEEIDEDFDTASDPENCGECAVVCPPRWHAATPICADSLCGFICDSGWVDTNGWPDDGCEAACTASGEPDANCDNVDDDCDGSINEDYASVTCSEGAGGPDCAGSTDCVLGDSGYREVCDVGREVPDEDLLCDLVDDDCDGETDEDFPGIPCGIGACERHSTCDAGAEVPCEPGLPDLPTDSACNGADDDCDGLTDEDWAVHYCGTGGCARPYACADGRETCVEGVAGPETCDGVDNDCDTLTDEEGAFGCTSFYADRDHDSYGSMTDWLCQCGPAGDYTVSRSGDCDDAAAAVNPGATEVCNSIDDDCDSTTDPENAGGCVDYYYDADSDGYGTGGPRCYCGPTGRYVALNSTDCDDTNAARNPGVAETCTTPADDDCDSVPNEQDALACTIFYLDADGDTWGTSANQCWCSASGDYRATRTGDCNDSDNSISPGRSDGCNGVDDDCDGSTDEDAGCPRGTTRACSIVVPTRTCNGTQTCSSGCSWGACAITDAEICNAIDDNCDGLLDPEGTTGCTNYYFDGDRDGYGVGAPRCYCSPTGNYSATNSLDCDDSNAGRNPGVSESCATPGDDDCDGVANEQDALSCTTYYTDVDRDTWGVSPSQCWCSPVGDFQATRSGDCNDGSAAINPGASETCNDVDDDCDTLTDETFACRIGATQACSVAVPTKTCSGTRTCSGSCAWGSCVVPETGGNIEICNGIDDDCDGTVDDPPTPPNVLCAPRPNATVGCPSGSCVIAGCSAGWADANGILTDGCECALESPEASGACGTAYNLGTFPDSGWDVTVAGKITSAADVDCFSFAAPDSVDGTCDAYHVDIRFTANPSSQFQMTVYRGNCTTVVCSGETSGYDWYTDFTTGSMTTKVGECGCRATNTEDYNLCNDSSSSYYFCVSRRVGFATTCDQYSIRVTNGVF